MMWNGYESWGWGFGALHMLGFWIVLILVLVVVVRGFSAGLTGRDSVTPASESPLDILKARYAKGEIDLKEFEEKKRVLTS